MRHGIHVKTDSFCSKTSSKPLISKGSHWIRSDNVWFAIVCDPVNHLCVHHFTSHIVQSVFSVQYSMDCHSGGTSSIHHDYSQSVQEQHRRPPPKLIHLKISPRLMKNSSNNRMKSPYLNFFTGVATELFGCSSDESMCTSSSKRVDHSSKIGMTMFHVQARHNGFLLFLAILDGQVQSSHFLLIESPMSFFFGWSDFVSIPLVHEVWSSSLAVNRHVTYRGMNLLRGLHLQNLFNNSLDELRCVLQRFLLQRLMR